MQPNVKHLQRSEALPLASVMSDAYCHYVNVAKEQLLRPAVEAIGVAESHANAIAASENCGDPKFATFFELAALAKVDPVRAEARWQQIRAAARAELVTGHRAASATDPSLSGRAWAR